MFECVEKVVDVVAAMCGCVALFMCGCGCSCHVVVVALAFHVAVSMCGSVWLCGHM